MPLVTKACSRRRRHRQRGLWRGPSLRDRPDWPCRPPARSPTSATCCCRRPPPTRTPKNTSTSSLSPFDVEGACMRPAASQFVRFRREADRRDPDLPAHRPPRCAVVCRRAAQIQIIGDDSQPDRAISTTYWRSTRRRRPPSWAVCRCSGPSWRCAGGSSTAPGIWLPCIDQIRARRVRHDVADGSSRVMLPS